MKKKIIALVARLWVVSVMCAGLGVMSQAPADAFALEDCREVGPIVDVESVTIETGTNNVDLGDDHWFGEPQGPVAICWERPQSTGQARVQLVGELYWDTGCGFNCHYVEDNDGCAEMKVSFSADGSTWGPRNSIASVCNYSGSGLATRYYNIVLTRSSSLDNIRVQLYRTPELDNGDMGTQRLVRTVTRVRG